MKFIGIIFWRNIEHRTSNIKLLSNIKLFQVVPIYQRIPNKRRFMKILVSVHRVECKRDESPGPYRHIEYCPVPDDGRFIANHT